MMPFGMGSGELLVFLLFALLIYGVPLVAGGWALVTLARIRSDQKEVLARIATIERHLTGRA